jgi:hypothetical protein
MTSGQVYVSFGEKLKIAVNSSAGQPGGLGWTAPSGWTPTDPNYGTIYADVEFTYTSSGLMNCDTTYVDMFTVPITIELTGSMGTQTAGGLTTSRTDVFNAFANAAAPLPSLIVGKNVRILNPQHAIGVTSFPSDYLDQAISAAWTNYQTNTLTVTISGTQYTGTVDSTTNALTFTPGSIGQPSTLEVFACSGVFVPPMTNPPTSDQTELAAIAAAVAAALNRGTLLSSASQPACDSSQFYQTTSNGYAQLLHKYSTGGQCYAFPYDDVCGTYSSDLNDPAATGLALTLNAF